MGQAVVSWIDNHAARTPRRTALVDLASGRSTGYGELSLRIRALAVGLTALGVGSGDRVAVLSRNDARVFEVLYACAHLGAICVPLNWRLAPSELIAITADARPAILIAESHLAAPAAAVTVDHRVTWASEPGDPDDYETLVATPVPDVWSPASVDEDEPWTIIYTSGTTGEPKGVVASHRNVVASVLGIVLAGQVDSSARCLTVLPTFHVAGLNLFANPVLLLGGTVVVMRVFDPERALDLLTDPDEPVTHFCGVPANFQFMEQLPTFADAPLQPFTAAVGGSAVPQALVEKWASRGVPLMTVYGITEAGACVLAMPPSRVVEKNGTVGLPVLHARIRISDPEGGPVEPGETGELEIGGPLVTIGYWERPDATAQAIGTDGWLRTGDAARIDADGYLVLVDRWKDMYISGGENVYPAEVENVLHSHPEVSQAAVVGMPDPRWGETGIAFVVPVRGATPSGEAIRAWCGERIARYKVPSRIEIVGELPRNATGKVLKATLRMTASAWPGQG